MFALRFGELWAFATAPVRRWVVRQLVDEPTPERLRLLYPLATRALNEESVNDAWVLGRAVGELAERARIGEVYAASLRRLEPAIERAMFDGVSNGKGAAQAMLAELKGEQAAAADAASRRAVELEQGDRPQAPIRAH